MSKNQKYCYFNKQNLELSYKNVMKMKRFKNILKMKAQNQKYNTKYL